MFLKLTYVLISFLIATTVQATPTEKVYFLSPKNNDKVEKTFKIKFAQKGLTIKPANQDIENKKAGHYHIIVDAGFIPEGQVIPTDTTHIHFGKGQTEAELTLTSGSHKLTLQFADGAHRSNGEKLSDTITVQVK